MVDKIIEKYSASIIAEGDVTLLGGAGIPSPVYRQKLKGVAAAIFEAISMLADQFSS